MKVFARKKKNKDMVKIIEALPVFENEDGFILPDGQRRGSDLSIRFYTLGKVTYLAAVLFNKISYEMLLVIYSTKNGKDWEVFCEHPLPESYRSSISMFSATDELGKEPVFTIRFNAGVCILDRFGLTSLACTKGETRMVSIIDGTLYRSSVNCFVIPSESQDGVLEYAIYKMDIGRDVHGKLFVNESEVRKGEASIAPNTYRSMDLGNAKCTVRVDIVASLNLTNGKNKITTFSTKRSSYICDISLFNGTTRTSMVTELHVSLYSKAYAFSVYSDPAAKEPYVALYRTGRINFIDKEAYRVLLSKTTSAVLYPGIRFINCLETNMHGFVTRNGSFFNDRIVERRVQAYSAELTYCEGVPKIKSEVLHRRIGKNTVLIDMCDRKIYETPTI